MVGRKGKPNHLHSINGTYRADRHDTDAPEPSSKKPIPPKHLSVRSRELFKIIVSRMEGWASETHTEMITLCAMAHEEIEQCSKLLINEDDTPCFSYVTSNTFGDKVLKQRPEVGQRQAAIRLAKSLLSDLGLSPTASRKVEKVTVEKKKDKKSAERFF